MVRQKLGFQASVQGEVTSEIYHTASGYLTIKTYEITQMDNLPRYFTMNGSFTININLPLTMNGSLAQIYPEYPRIHQNQFHPPKNNTTPVSSFAKDRP